NENIKPYFKDKKLNEIDGLDIQKFLNSIKRNNTRVKVGNIIRASFEKAVKLRIIKYNPYSSVEIPAIKSKHYKPLEFDQQNEILKLITNPIYYPVFFFMCCTGLRIGEFLALNFSKDIDYTTNEIIINKSIDVYTNTIHNSTKTESGMRKVKFHSDLIPYIQELEKNQRSGKRYTYSMVRCYFKRLYAKLGYKGYNIHTFRHTFISVCYYVGMREKYIQKLVGHASLDMTLNTYTHILKRGNSPILEYIQKLKDIL
ncbi:MAG: site-specific integrase, partial [Clostridiales bacterium]|nr:site-specific integrase [Clostridiales bacterium]